MDRRSLRILFIGDPETDIKYYRDKYDKFLDKFDVLVREEQDKVSWIKALQENKYGDFVGILKPVMEKGTECGRLERDVIELLPKSLKIVSCGGAGFDWADVDVLAENNIIYTNASGVGDASTSDITIYLILAVFRLTTQSEQAARTGDLEEFQKVRNYLNDSCVNPEGQTLGLIGFGRIARQVARKAQVFGLRVIYNDVKRQSVEVERELGVEYVEDRAALLKASDCISVSVPLMPATHHLIGRQEFGLMKQGSRFVNTSRGPVVDEAALVEALDTGKLFSAGLDVHEREPIVNQLLMRPNVTLLTHIGGSTQNTRSGFERLSMENIELVISGKQPLTQVN